jgi:nucleotide-binding universal stress UspA family protein
MAQAASLESAGRIEAIVCGMDFTLESDLACAGAAELARAYSARLLLVHVAAGADAARAARERLAVYMPSWLEGVSTTSLVRTGDPAHEVARVARQERAGLIVIGVHRPDHPLIPTGVEAGLTESAPCPVLPVRGRDDARRALDRLAGRVAALRRCHVCGRPFDTTICSACGARITSEARDHKWHHDLREGPGLIGHHSLRAFGPNPDAAPEPPAARTAPPPRRRRWSLLRLLRRSPG